MRADMTQFGPWVSDAPWYIRAICFVFGHDPTECECRLQECYRCRAFRWKLP